MRGVHHISLKAKGAAAFEGVLAFYRDVLGCPLVRRCGKAEEKGLFAHIAFAADDVDGMARRVREAGYPVFLGPEDKNLGGDYPIRIAFCTGPAGEEIEFFQER